MSKWNNKLKA